MKCSQCEGMGLVLVDQIIVDKQFPSGRRVSYAAACTCQNGQQFRGRAIEVEGRRRTFDIRIQPGQP